MKYEVYNVFWYYPNSLVKQYIHVLQIEETDITINEHNLEYSDTIEVVHNELVLTVDEYNMLFKKSRFGYAYLSCYEYQRMFESRFNTNHDNSPVAN